MVPSASTFGDGEGDKRKFFGKGIYGNMKMSKKCLRNMQKIVILCEVCQVWSNFNI